MKFHLPLGLLKVLLAVVCLPATTIAAALTDVTIGSSGEKITSDMVSINGVKLSDGLASGITADFTDNENGSFTLSSTGDKWDERWGKNENDPEFSRIYAGTDAAANVELAAGIEGNTNYYRYSSIVDEANDDEADAAKVNNGKAIVATLSSVASGELVAGSRIDENDVIAYDHEVWIEDRSKFENIIGGVDNSSGKWSDTVQTAATHILVNSTVEKDTTPPVDKDRSTWEKEFIIAGSRWTAQGSRWGNAASNWQPLVAESYVTVLDGEIYTIFGGSCGGEYETENWGYKHGVSGDQYGTSHVFVDGGRIGEIFAAGMWSTLTGTQVVDGRENKRAVEMVITGGTLGGHDLRVFGGGERGDVYGDIYIRMEGNAEIKSQLVGGSNVGKVHGNIEMDLISGYAFRVDAAGIGWGNVEEGLAYIDGDVQVNLYRAGTHYSTSDDIFRLGSVADIDPARRLIGGIYGGKETTNYVEITKTGAEIMLHFAESGRYELASIGSEGYETSAQSVVVTGFDRFKLENNAHVVLGLGLFDMDMDDPNDSINPEALVISGEGVVEVIGHGIKYYVPIEDEDGNIKPEKEERDERNLGRDILLEDSATLKISTSVIGSTGSEDDRTITVKSGSTIDFSGAPAETGYTGDSDFAGLGFNVVIEGHGVEGKGAIYKGKNDDSWYPVAGKFSTMSQRVILPNVELTSSASVKVEAGETLLMNNASELDGGGYAQGTAHLGLNKHTFTKMGEGDFIARSVEMTAGTVLVQQGGFGFDLTDNASQTDMVLADGAELKLNASGLGKTNLTLRSLNGAGTVNLNGSTLTLHTEADSEADSPHYYGEYMTDVYTGDASSYDQFSETTGFGYAVFSGMISDGSAAGSLVKDGSGVHYISGSANTYSGGTRIDDGRLYLLGTSTQSGFDKGGADVAFGVVGTGAIIWAGANAELYLGHGARIYNEGTVNVAGGVMTIGVEGVPIGVEGAPNGVLADFVGIHSKDGDSVIMGGVEYVEIDTHNLKSIDVAAVYADGTAYAARTDIDRNKMLLVKKSEWETARNTEVTGFSDTGYNEAIYSGVLYDSNNVAASLHKVGVGVLVLNGDNSYSGGTYVSCGTVEVQSATGLGATASGQGTVTIVSDADLRVTVEEGYTGKSLVTSLAADKNDIQGDVTISGTADTERILHMDGNGYSAHSTTLNDNGTLLLNGAAIDGAAVTAESVKLTGSGKVVVSDASGSGASATFDSIDSIDSMINYSGDFRVEGDNASIKVQSGTFSGGSIHVAGNNALVNIGSDISITYGNSLSLSSLGDADATQNTAAMVQTDGAVSIKSGAVFSVQNKETSYAYDLSGLQNSAAFALEESVQSSIQSDNLLEVRAYQTETVGSVTVAYDGRFVAANAVNLQAVGAVQAKGGLTLAGGATYETSKGHTSLMGGSLTLDTMENSLLTFHTTPDKQYDPFTGEAQLVLFSGVNSVYFLHDNVEASSDSGIYYTMASRYLTGSEFIDDNTVLVYDSGEGVVYLQHVVPEPATATLSLLALAALAARRRRASR